jgi:predicted aspartyl protease
MRVIGRINNQNLVVLIYGGSIHKFLNSSMAKEIRLLLNKKHHIRVKVANGEEVLSEGKCNEVQIQIKDMTFKLGAFVENSR